MSFQGREPDSIKRVISCLGMPALEYYLKLYYLNQPDIERYEVLNQLITVCKEDPEDEENPAETDPLYQVWNAITGMCDEKLFERQKTELTHFLLTGPLYFLKALVKFFKHGLLSLFNSTDNTMLIKLAAMPHETLNFAATTLNQVSEKRYKSETQLAYFQNDVIDAIEDATLTVSQAELSRIPATSTALFFHAGKFVYDADGDILMYGIQPQRF